MRGYPPNDPLLLIIAERQAGFLKEAEQNRLAAQAVGLLGADGRPQRKPMPIIISIWRRTAWGLGKAAVSLGGWLLAR